MTPLAAYLLLFIAGGVAFILVHLVAGSLIRPARPDAEKDTIYECGEPTIGSAWIQFDLRYYVVALLFVVFDVEVAFFFPWAEVFGKANAVANARKPETAAEYKAYAEKVLDLARPGTSEEHQRFEAMRELADDDLKAEIETRRGLEAKLAKQGAAAEKQKKGGALSEAEKADLAWEPGKGELTTLLTVGRMKRSLASALKGDEGRTEFDEKREAAQTFAMLALLEVLVFFGVLLVGFAYLWRRGDLQWVRSLSAEEPAAKAEPAARELVGSK